MMSAALSRVFTSRPPVAVVALNSRPRRAPWGGGNQWLHQITRSLRHAGYEVRHTLRGDIDCILLADSRRGGSTTFDIDAIAEYKVSHPTVPCLQRVNDNDKHRASDFRDAIQAEGNRVADHTVFLSAWLRDYESERWFDLNRPHSVIHNGADSRVFHPIGRTVFDGSTPFRLVTHHWSNDWNKGFAVYAEIDRLIADGNLPGVELWVIGRWPDTIAWRAARTFPPVRGEALARLLRQCHAYVTASRWEAGGMHFIEGIQCGLPVLYHVHGGGVVELAGRFGIAYSEDVRAGILEMQARYAEFRQVVLEDPPSGDRMCLEYRTLIQGLVDAKRAGRVPGPALAAGRSAIPSRVASGSR